MEITDSLLQFIVELVDLHYGHIGIKVDVSKTSRGGLRFIWYSSSRREYQRTITAKVMQDVDLEYLVDYLADACERIENEIEWRKHLKM